MEGIDQICAYYKCNKMSNSC